MITVLASCAAIALGLLAGRSDQDRNTQPPPLTSVTQVSARRDAFAGQRLRVRGRIVTEELMSAGAGPCNRVTGEGCNPVAMVRLHLADPDHPASGDRVDLYRASASGRDEPITCRILEAGSYDCAPYTAGSVVVLEGIFKRYPEPVQQVIHPDGRADVIRTRDIFFLVVSEAPR